jgi:large subunit ribosomal protein L25
MIPAVCYGRRIDPFTLSIAPDVLNSILFSPKGRNTVVQLEVGGKSYKAMIQDVQRHPVKRVPIHVDFRVVEDEDLVTVNVPVQRVGRARGEAAGGRLVPVRRTVEVRCSVEDIPDVVTHDVTEIRLGGKVLCSDLIAPPNSEIVFKSDFVVLRVEIPRGADEDEEVEEEGEGAIEEEEEEGASD